MARNIKPMLTILIDEEKLQRLRNYAAGKQVSMGWVVNRLVDRVLSGEIEIGAKYQFDLPYPQH